MIKIGVRDRKATRYNRAAAALDWNNIRNHRNVFDALSIAFTTYRLYLQEDLGDALYEELRKFMEEIENHK